MKILITTDLYAESTNGVVTSVKNLMEELTKNGHEIRILTVSEKMKSRKEGPVYYMKSVPLDYIYPNIRMPISDYFHSYIREIVEWKPDLIHSQCEFFSYDYAIYIARKCNVPIIHTYHTLYEQYATYIFPSQRLGAFFVGKFAKYRLRNADAVVAPTAKVEAVLKKYGLQNPIYIVPSGIALEQHKQRITEEERKRRRARLGIDEDALVLLNLGRLGTEKNLTEIVELFAMARSENSRLMLMIVGDGPARKELEEKAQALGVRDGVIFTGMVAPEEVHVYYQLGDVFVSASTSETQGLTYVEAAANGLPLLCRKDPCLDGVLIDGHNGWGYEAEQEFCEIIDAILSDPQQRQAAGSNSERIAAAFDKGNLTEKIVDIYESAVQ